MSASATTEARSERRLQALDPATGVPLGTVATTAPVDIPRVVAEITSSPPNA